MSTSKVITVAIKANDQASAPIRKMIAQLKSVGSSVLSVARQTASAASMAGRAVASTARVLTSLRTVMVGGLAALLAGKLVGSLRSVVDELDELGEQSKRLGIPAELMQTLRYEAQKANVEASALFKTFSVGQRTLGDIARGRNSKAAETLKQLGIDVRDANGRVLTMNELLPTLQQRLAALGLPQASKDSILAQLFGRGGPDVISRLFASGDFGAASKRLRELNGIASQADIAKAAAMSDALDDLSIAWKSVKRELLSAIGPGVTSVLNAFAERLAKMPDSVRGISRALVEALGGGATSQEALDLLDDLKANLLGALKTTAIEFGKALGQTLVSSLTYAIVAVGPRLGDVLGDIMKPIVRDLTGGFIDLPKSLAGQLADAERRIEEVRAAARAFADEQENLFSNPYLDGQDRVFAEQRLSAMKAVLGGEPDAVIAEAKRKHEELVKQLALQTSSRVEAAQLAFREGIAESEAAWNRAGSSINKEWSAVGFTLDDLADYYKRLNPEATPEGQEAQQGIVQFSDKAASALVRGIETIGSKLKSFRDRVKGFATGIADLVKAASVMRELELRQQSAFGGTANENSVALARLEIAQMAERHKAMTEYGSQAKRVLETLVATQQVERQRLVLDQQLAAQQDLVTKAGEAYSQMLEQRAQLVEAGSMSEQMAQLANATSQREYVEQLRQARAAVEQLAQSAGPQFDAVVRPVLQGVGREIDLITGKAQAIASGDWRRGIIDGIKDIRSEASNLYSFARDFVKSISSSIGSGLANAFIDVIGGVRSLKDAMRDFLASTLRMVSQLIMQLLIMRAIAGILGSVGTSTAPVPTTGWRGFGAVAPGLSNGRSVRHEARGSGAKMMPLAGLQPGMLVRGYDGGGLVRGGANLNRDTALIAAAAKEYVVSRKGVAANGSAVMNHINAGGKVAPIASDPGSGTMGGLAMPITINVYGSSDTTDIRKIEQAVQRGVLNGLQQSPAFRKAMKGALL